jgi:competence protein ComEC
VNAYSSCQHHPDVANALGAAHRPTVSARHSWMHRALTALACATLGACASSGSRSTAPEPTTEPEQPQTSLPDSESPPPLPKSDGPFIAFNDRRMTSDGSRTRSEPAGNSRLRPAGSDRRKPARRAARAAVAAPLPALTFSPRRLLPGEMAVHMVDVGQGDSILVEFNCGAALIDTGVEWSSGSNSKQRLTQYLDMFFNERRPELNHTLKLVIVSHGHADHADGIPLLLDRAASFGPLTIQNVVDSGYDTDGRNYTANEQMDLRAAVLAGGGNADSIKVDDIEWYSGATSTVIDPFRGCPGEVNPQFAVLWGDWSNYASAPDNPNHHSVVTRLDFGESSFLFTGDLQTDDGHDGGLDVILDDYAADLSAFDVDVLKVSHHGAENGTTKALVDATTPCMAVMGVGDPTRVHTGTAGAHGHPRRSTLNLLQAQGGGVTGTRPTRRVQAFNAAKGTTVRTELKRAIFGTAWDGHYVVYARADGALGVETEHGEQVVPGCGI